MYVLEVLRFQKLGDFKAEKGETVSQQYFLEEDKSKAEEIRTRLNAHFCANAPKEPAVFEARLIEVI